MPEASQTPERKRPRLYSADIIRRTFALIERRMAEEKLPHKKGRPICQKFRLAEVCRRAGLNYHTMIDWKRGRRPISFPALDALLFTLDISILDLIHSNEVVDIYDNVLDINRRAWAKKHSRFLANLDEPLRRKSIPPNGLRARGVGATIPDEPAPEDL